MDTEEKCKEEQPARNKYYNATITVCANGFIVSIGCQTVVAETPEKLLELITGYLKNPKEAEKKLFANSMWNVLSTEKATREEKEKVCNEYIQKVTEQVRRNFQCDLEAVEEDAAIFNGLMLKTRQAFEKAKNEHYEASEKLWDKFNDEIPSVTKKTEEILSTLKPITTELSEIEKLLQSLNTWNIERFVEAFRAFSSLNEQNKEMFEFLVHNFKPKAEGK